MLSPFTWSLDDMLLSVCDTSKTMIYQYPGNGTLASYLFLRSQDIEDEFKPSDSTSQEIDDDNEFPSLPSTSNYQMY